MSISSITSSSVTAASATSAVSSLDSQVSSGSVSSPTGGDRTQLSTLGELMSKLQNLETTDPGKAKQVLTSIATALTDQANSSGSTDPRLKALADKFTDAASTGDLSGLQPKHGHHHHPDMAAGGASASSDASGAASSTSSKTASYAQGGSDAMGQLASIISSALSSAGV